MGPPEACPLPPPGFPPAARYASSAELGRRASSPIVVGRGISLGPPWLDAAPVPQLDRLLFCPRSTLPTTLVLDAKGVVRWSAPTEATAEDVVEAARAVR